MQLVVSRILSTSFPQLFHSKNSRKFSHFLVCNLYRNFTRKSLRLVRFRKYYRGVAKTTQTTKSESFVTKVNGFQTLIAAVKLFILDIYGSPSFASGFTNHKITENPSIFHRFFLYKLQSCFFTSVYVKPSRKKYIY